MNDPIRSIIQTQHPQLADEVRHAIDVMEKVLQIAGPPPEGGRSDRAQPELLATAELQKDDIEATSDSQASIDTQGPRSAQVPSLACGEAFGRYQIINMLGQGAMGAVYLAYDPPLQRHVAIKIPIVRNSIALERFYIEARATATLRSPNICPVHDVGQINGVHFISMAFIEGKPLSKVISESQMSVEHASEIVAKTARGIQKAHERGVIHRDIKPDNIMVDADGEPVVMDFGLAVRSNDQEEDARLTHAGALVGSPAYMSPEQAEGRPELIGPSTDIYSLGVVLYQMLTQRLPFEGSITAVLKQIASDPPTPPSMYNVSLTGSPIEKICLQMLKKSPSDRFPCMGDVAEAAEDCKSRVAAQKVGGGKRRFFWPFG